MSQFLNRAGDEQEQETAVDIKGYINRVLAQWWIIPLSLAICLGTSYLYLRYKSKMYKIHAQLLVQDDKKGGGMNAGDLLDLSSLLDMKSNVDNEVEILKTRMLAEKVVKDLNLNITYFKKGRVNDVEIYQRNLPFALEILGPEDSIAASTFDMEILEPELLLIEYVDSRKNTVSNKVSFGKTFIMEGIGALRFLKNNNISLRDKYYRFHISSVQEAVSTLRKEIIVAVTNKLVTTIDLSMSHHIPKKGEDILSKLIEEYLEQNIVDKNRVADSTIKFINERLLFVSRELGDIEGDIQSFKQGNKLADLSEQSRLLLVNTSDYLKRIAEIETQLNILAGLEDYLKDESKNKRVVPSSVLANDIVFSKLVETYNGLLLERDRQLLTSTEDNPYIRNLDERIQALRGAMLSNLANTRASMQISQSQLQKDLNQFENQIRNVPAHERTYLDLARQQQIKQELYLFLLQKREEAALSKTSNISSARVIDAPKSDSLPFSPNKMVILLFGLAAGLALPFGRVYIMDILNDKVRSKEELLKLLPGMTVIGEISHFEMEGTSIGSDPKSVIAEQFRGLRTNLHFFLKEQQGNIILLTSSTMGEGKTFTSTNLGAILAIPGKRVLLMDLDLRRASLSAKLGFKGSQGFTNYIISNAVKASDLIVPSGIHEKLFILPAGPIPPNPAELIMDQRMDELMSELKQDYDYIIMDAPPIGLVTDAQLLSRFSAITLYLVRQEYTSRNMLNIPKELHLSGKMERVAIVLNDVRRPGGYGYAYAYGYYAYGNKVEKKGWIKNIIERH
jgi:tyrosine-protein kinase Etk/Wzc